MRAISGRCAAASVLLALPFCAYADLDSAFKAYDAQQFERAYADFRELAELGSPLAQLNTGLMLTNGEGVKADVPGGYAWILAARDNGSGKATELAKQMESRFDVEQKASAQAHVERYGRAGTRSRLFPMVADPATIKDLSAAKPTGPLRVESPDSALVEGTLGFVETVLILGRDGAVHDVWVNLAAPQDMFESSVLSSARKWRFTPANSAAGAIAVASTYRFDFGLTGKDGKDLPRLVKLLAERRAAARDGKPQAQYQVARLLVRFPELSADEGEMLRMLQDAAKRGYPPAQQYLGLCMLGRAPQCQGAEGGGLEMLARAGQSGNDTAQLLMAILSMAEGGAEGLVRARQWLEPGARAHTAQNEKYLASIMASAPQAELRDGARAVALIEPLLKRSGYARDPDVWQVHAAAKAELGAWRDAVDSQERAIGLVERFGWDGTGPRERLAAYRKSTPWRGDLLGLANVRWLASVMTGDVEVERCEETPQAGSRIKRCEDSTSLDKRAN